MKIRIRQNDLFIEDSIKYVTIGIEDKGIKAVIGKLKSDPHNHSVIESFVFDKSKWKLDEIRKWVKENAKHYEWIFSQAKDTDSLGWLMGKNTTINLSEGKEYEMKPVTKLYDCELKDFNEKERTFTAIASTETKDRDGDIMRVSGAKLKNFRKNPVVLFGHDDRSLPVAKATDIRVDGDKLLFKPKFATSDMNPFADQVFKMFKGGFLRAFSIRFDPIKFEVLPSEEKNPDPFERLGREFKQWELLEISAVNIPANPEALKSATYLDFVQKSFVKTHGGKDGDIQLHKAEDIRFEESDKKKEEPEQGEEKKEEIKLKTDWEDNTEQEIIDDTTQRLEAKKDRLDDLKVRKEMQDQEKELDNAIEKLEKEIDEDIKLGEALKKMDEIKSGVTALGHDKKEE